MSVTVGVLGPVTAWGDDHAPLPLRGPRHRELLGRLVAARGRVVTVDRLVDDLWDDPPEGAVAAVRTFVAALRRSLEPDRPARAPARLLVTDGPGYALRDVTVDAWAVEEAVTRARTLPAGDVVASLDTALARWRGPAYAGVEAPWAVTERARLTELRLAAVESRAAARLALGQATDVVPDLDGFVSEHPWREEGWRLLALALYRGGRQGDALAVLRRARAMLAGELGTDPGPRLAALEADVLRHDVLPGPAPDDLWHEATAAYERAVAAGARSRLESTATLLASLAVTGAEGLAAARAQRLPAVRAAEQLGDPYLTARVISAFDVPGAWTRSDDPDQAAQTAAAAERALAALPPTAPLTTRARLLTTVALESRGTAGRGREAALEAEEIARRAADPSALAFALAGRYLHRFERSGLAPERAAIGAELVGLADRHGLVTFGILGHLVQMQALSALADGPGALSHAEAAERLGLRHERPLVGVLTAWSGALQAASDGADTDDVESSFRTAAALPGSAAMPGFSQGLLPLAVLALRVGRGIAADGPDLTEARWGPYGPWSRPHLLLATGRREEAAAAVRRLPAPPPDLLQEVLWVLAGRAAIAVDDLGVAQRARDALAPAAGELAAGSGVLTAGAVAEHLRALDAALGAPGPAPAAS